MEEFIMKTKIYMGEGSLESIQSIDMQKVYIICDPFMVKSGAADKIITLLQKKNICYHVFSDIVPDPTIAVVSDCVSNMSGFKPDTVIVLGGGSAIDTAKAACYIYEKASQMKKPNLIAVPTTSGTGSEVTSFSVISDPEAQAKYPLRDPAMVPDIAILDPQFTITVPPHITADTGMDVLTHALEAYVSTKAGDFTDACAEKAIRLVMKYLDRAVADGANMEAREHMHNASCLAGIAFNGASLGICHSMAHALGGRFHLSHGRSNAILLPHVICYNAELEEDGECEALHRYAKIAGMLGIHGGTEKASVHGLIRQIRNLMNRIGIPHQITETGIDREEYKQAIKKMAQKAVEDSCTKTNPRLSNPETVEALYLRLSKGGNS